MNKEIRTNVVINVSCNGWKVVVLRPRSSGRPRSLINLQYVFFNYTVDVAMGIVSLFILNGQHDRYIVTMTTQ